MEEKKDCKIVQDLLPNYVENLTNDVSIKYIKNHLDTCKDCEKIYNDMKKNLESNMNKTNKKEINFLKKYNNKLRVLRIILLVISIIFVASIGWKMIILSDLSNKSNQYVNSTNYHTVTYSYNKENYTKTEVFRLNNRIKMIINNVTDDGATKITMFGNEIIKEIDEITRYSTNIYVTKPDSKIAILNQDMGMINPLKSTFRETSNLWNLFQYAIHSSITTSSLNGKDCYYIANYYPEGFYVDKETGFPINSVAYEYENSDGTKSRSDSKEYIYEFNTVTEDSFVEPNISEYEITDKFEF